MRCLLSSFRQVSCLGVFFSLLPVSAAYDLYWTESEVIMGSDIDGETPSVVFDGAGMAGDAVDILVTTDYLYWTDHADGTASGIWRAGRDGSNPEKILDDSDILAPHFMALEESSERIYFTDFRQGIFRIDQEGANLDWVFNGRDPWPTNPETYTGLILRGPGDPLFLNQTRTLYELGDDGFGGTSADPVADLPGGGQTYGAVFDEASNTLYYTTYGEGSLWSYHLDTGEEAELLTGLTDPLGLKFSPSQTHLVIAERGRGISAYQIANGGYGLLVESADAHFGVAATADPGELDPWVEPLAVLWSLSPEDRSYLTTNDRQRGMAIHPEEGHVLLVHRGAPPVVPILDGMTGDEIGMLSVEGVSGGFGSFHLNKIAVAEDGTIYAGNLAVDTRNDNYRLYRWTDLDADPELVFDAALNSEDDDGSNRRFGDSIVVRGTGEETEIFLNTWNGTIWSRLTPLPEEEITDPDNQFAAEMIPLSGVTPNSLRDIALGEGNLFYGSRSGSDMPLYEIEFDPVTLTSSAVRTFSGSVLSVRIGPVGLGVEHGFLGGIHAWDSVFYLYRVEDLDEDAETAIPPVATRGFPTNHENGNRTGVIAFHNGIVYALETNNGIMAMDLGLPSDAEPVSFETWIAKFDLPSGQSGPGDNPVGDGVENLMKYALGLDPTVSSRDGLPEPGFETIDGERYLRLSFSSPDGIEDLHYSVEVGAEPGGNFYGSAEPVNTVPDPDRPDHSIHTYRDSDPIPANARRFMRLVVE